MPSFFRVLLGPRLFRLYQRGDRQGYEYQGNVLEHYSDNLIKTALFSLSMAYSLGIYTSPIIASYMYRKGYISIDGLSDICRYSGSFGLLLFFTVFIRGIGRMVNSDYITFLSALEAYKQNMSRELKYEMSRYDFDFQYWPVDFYWNQSDIGQDKPKIYIEKQNSERRNVFDKIKGLPSDILSYLAMHTFGRMMIYPGSVTLLNKLFTPMLLKSRAKLIEQHYGERFKLVTEDGNHIDSIFIDRRQQHHFINGNILVICCEGNSGFYEYGITFTPTEAGYSVLGWNHPGFGSSTGTPYPDQELNAMDVVIKFAVSKLGFRFEEILIYAWSIGGFSATWAAMNYPNIKGLILDATFDDLVMLAVSRMPPSWRPLIVKTIRDYMDLNNAEQLCRYDGPVLLIRRTKDEIISISASRSLQTNRGNDLLIKLFEARFPKLVTEDTEWALKDYLSGDKNHQTILWSQQNVDEELCETTLASYMEENSSEFPMQIGDNLPTDMKIQLVLYLANKHMIDFNSTHCVQLPARLFQRPWDIRSITSNWAQSLRQNTRSNI